MKLKRIHLIRHGQSVANIDGLVCGQIDSPLSHFGKMGVSVASQSDFIKNLLHLPCYVSPLCRAIETALLLGFVEIRVENDLMETNTGDFSLKTMKELATTNPEFSHYMTDLNARYPNGETTLEMLERSWKCFLRIAHSEEEVVLVAHGGPFNSISANLLGVPFKGFPSFLFQNNKITTLIKAGGFSSWSLEKMNVV